MTLMPKGILFGISNETYLSLIKGMTVMEELKVLARRVKKLRLEYGVAQTKLANEIGTSQTNMSNMEAGRTAITVQNLFKIQKVLGCKMKDFFVDFDGEEVVEVKQEENATAGITLEDAVNILKLLKAVEVKGL